MATLPDNVTGSPIGEAPPKAGGFDPMRIVRILQQRWPLVAAGAVVCGALAVAAALLLAEPIFRAQGILQFERLPIPENLKAIYTPPKFDDRLAQVKSRENMEAVGEKFNMPIEHTVLARQFKAEQLPNTEQISIILDWPSADDGAAMVNYLMETFVDRVVSERVERIDIIAKDQARSLNETRELLATRRGEYQQFLAKAMVEDLKGELDRITKELTNSESQLATSRQNLANTEGQVKKVKGDIDDLTRKVKAKEPLPQAVQDAHEKRLREFKAKHLIEDGRLKETKQELDTARSKKTTIEKLVRDKAASLDELKEINKQVAVLQVRYDTSLATVKQIDDEIRDEQKNPARAYLEKYEARLEDLESARSGLDKQIKEVMLKLDELRKESNRLTRIQKDSEQLENTVKRLEESRIQLEAQITALRTLSGRDVKEFTVNTAAKPNKSPFGSNAKKIAAMTFAVPMALYLAVLIGLTLASDSSKAESLAGKLRVPVLARARATPVEGYPGKLTKQLSQEDVRGLALRLRQYVSTAGGMLLFSSTNDGDEVDELVGGLSRFLAMRDEKVLIVDTRIANHDLAVLTKVVERPVEIVAGDSAMQEEADPCYAGLVQYLVFEGQNPEDFIHPTVTRGVYFMPAGGPHAMTDALASEPMKLLLERLRKKYSVLLLVGPSAAHTTDTEILAAYVNGIIVVINGAASAFAGADAVFQSLKEANAPLVGTVLYV